MSPRTAPPQPLIAIVGATGTGKSQLAVELASRFDGEIINGDALQMYDGLPIITNKMAAEDRRKIPHHLLGCVGLEEPPWRVDVFTQKAIGVIDEIRRRGKLPILVGGTHYYTQSLLFEDALLSNGPAKDGAEATQEWDAESILNAPTEQILSRLREVDPVMADRWHPNDRRKVQRSLEIYLSTGRRASDIYEEQRQRRQIQRGDDATAHESSTDDRISSVRCPTMILWVHADAEVLKTRLDRRVDDMVQVGLLAEVQQLEEYRRPHHGAARSVDLTRGIWIAIGYKEFHDYVSALREGGVGQDRLDSLREQAIERTKAATRQYARRQVRWIRIRLCKALSEAGMARRLCLLDGSDLERWTEHVVQPASDLVEAFLQGGSPPSLPSVSVEGQSMLVVPEEGERRSIRRCDLCGTATVMEEDWAKHMESRRHRNAVRARSKHRGSRDL
ncbi:MAG: hypothetical protein M1838_003995 [Thelocarpon superellum]|nr:MAG: hypothetical protein M1838_003995 [Thelocarpon superellum]